MAAPSWRCFLEPAPPPPAPQIISIKSSHDGRLEQYKSDGGGRYVGDRWAAALAARAAPAWEGIEGRGHASLRAPARRQRRLLQCATWHILSVPPAATSLALCLDAHCTTIQLPSQPASPPCCQACCLEIATIACLPLLRRARHLRLLLAVPAAANRLLPP